MINGALELFVLLQIKSRIDYKHVHEIQAEPFKLDIVEESGKR